MSSSVRHRLCIILHYPPKSLCVHNCHHTCVCVCTRVIVDIPVSFSSAKGRLPVCVYVCLFHNVYANPSEEEGEEQPVLCVSACECESVCLFVGGCVRLRSDPSYTCARISVWGHLLSLPAVTVRRVFF